jgi:hypothetical protein
VAKLTPHCDHMMTLSPAVPPDPHDVQANLARERVRVHGRQKEKKKKEKTEGYRPYPAEGVVRLMMRLT